MEHFADPEFWYHYRRLRDEIRELADKNFSLLNQSPRHPSLHLKKIRGREDLWSARVGRDYRALAVAIDDGLQWFWIETHADYERLIGS
jgi:mRNA-degrading endonuclease RelE of RelBE toxin-antitoxin system